MEPFEASQRGSLRFALAVLPFFCRLFYFLVHCCEIPDEGKSKRLCEEQET